MPVQTQNIHPDSAETGSEVSRRLLASTPWKDMGPLVDRLLLLDDIERLCAAARKQNPQSSFFSNLLKCLDLSCHCSEEDLGRIPATGPVVVVANHPFGLAEGPSLGSLLLGIRRDVRFLANSLLLAIPELREYVIAVDPFAGVGSVRANLKPMRDAIEWVRTGGLLVVFPAGEVSSLQVPTGEIRDPEWNESVARLVRITRASVVPVFFHGANSAAFHLAGLAHPRLRTILLSREFLNKRGTTIRVSIGGPIFPQSLERLKTHRETVDYLRERTQLLEARKNAASKPEWPFAWKPSKPLPVAAPVESRLLLAEMERLDPARTLVESGDYSVSIASADEIPNLLLEIGRLREIAFRQAGEGTGRALDLDLFDQRYQHLWVWHRERNEVVGAYRLAGTDLIRARYGSGGLYTGTLFRFRPDFIPRIDPAIELGRSFVRSEYQKSYVPLLLLWKGIGRFVARNPRYRLLFGPVSISNDYSSASRALMVSYLKAHCYDNRFAGSVMPKSKFRAPWLLGDKLNRIAPRLSDIEELSKVVADLEPDGKGVPVLLRQYLNVGGQLLDFSVDGKFSRALDGLIVVDLVKANRGLLKRYLGEAGAEQFLNYHASVRADAGVA